MCGEELSIIARPAFFQRDVVHWLLIPTQLMIIKSSVYLCDLKDKNIMHKVAGLRILHTSLNLYPTTIQSPSGRILEQCS